MKSNLHIGAAAILALAFGCAQEDLTTTDTGGDTNTPETTTGSSTNSDVPMTYGDGVAGATPPGASDSSTSQTVTAAKVAQETREALKTTGDFIAQNKDELIAEVEQELKIVDARLDELEAHAKTLTADARTEWDKRWETIQEKRVALRTRLDELSTSTSDAWEELRDGTQQAWNEFESAVENAASQFDDDSSRPTTTDGPAAPN